MSPVVTTHEVGKRSRRATRRFSDSDLASLHSSLGHHATGRPQAKAIPRRVSIFATASPLVSECFSSWQYRCDACR